MKLSISTLMLTLALILAAERALADDWFGENWYTSLSGDLTWAHHTEMGGGANVALGYRFVPTENTGFRVEGEAGYHAAGGDDGYGRTHYFTYMGNLYYDFVEMGKGFGWGLAPYIGAGVGNATVHRGSGANGRNIESDHSLAWQGMVGVGLVDAEMPNTTWSVGYRYLNTEDNDLESNNIQLAVRFDF